MKKIPVLATIRDAYNFTFTHLGAIIGLIWAPMILVTVIGFFVMRRFWEACANALASGNLDGVEPEALGVLFFLIAALLLFTMMAVPVTQLALGTRKQGALIHFSFGGVEWRLFRGVMGLVGFLLVPTLVISVVGGLLSNGGGGLPAPLQDGQAIVGLYILWFIGIIYFGLRFGVLMPALSVSENGPLLPRAWNLTAGNFWRILAVMAAVYIPVEIFANILRFAAGGAQQMPPPTGNFSTAMMAKQMQAMAMNMPQASGIDFLMAPVLLGLVWGAGASIYRSLTHGPDVSETD